MGALRIVSIGRARTAAHQGTTAVGHRLEEVRPHRPTQDHPTNAMSATNVQGAVQVDTIVIATSGCQAARMIVVAVATPNRGMKERHLTRIHPSTDARYARYMSEDLMTTAMNHEEAKNMAHRVGRSILTDAAPQKLSTPDATRGRTGAAIVAEAAATAKFDEAMRAVGSLLLHTRVVNRCGSTLREIGITRSKVAGNAGGDEKTG